MADAHELIAEMRVQLAIGQRVRHTDYKRQRVTGVVHGLSIEAERGLMVTVLLDEPIVIPPIAGIEGDRETLIYWQTAQAHEFAPFDERDEQIASLVESLKEILNLCAIGDVDEDTEAYGWGDAIKAARRAIADAVGGTGHV
jgi:hypothetical protein